MSHRHLSSAASLAALLAFLTPAVSRAQESDAGSAAPAGVDAPLIGPAALASIEEQKKELADQRKSL